MIDSFGRTIDTIRISLTNRCNLNCFYCNPDNNCSKSNFSNINNSEISIDTIFEVVKSCIKLGINRVKFTGGEPLIRKDLVKIVSKVSKINGLKDLSITTNGIFLKDLAFDLKNNGLNRVNISLDTLNKDKYKEITGFDQFDKVLEGIFEAKKVGFEKIKINTVVIKSVNEDEIDAIKSFCLDNGLEFQTINMMVLSNEKKLSENCFTNKPPPCYQCSRIRLTSDGKLLPCLFYEEQIQIGDNIEKSIIECINKKPKEGDKNSEIMKNIGG